MRVDLTETRTLPCWQPWNRENAHRGGLGTSGVSGRSASAVLHSRRVGQPTGEGAEQYTLDRFLGQLERAHLLICDELGYVCLSRGGVELLFRVFGDRYERASVLITSNLPFSEWNQIFQGERMTGRWTV